MKALFTFTLCIFLTSMFGQQDPDNLKKDIKVHKEIGKSKQAFDEKHQREEKTDSKAKNPIIPKTEKKIMVENPSKKN